MSLFLGSHVNAVLFLAILYSFLLFLTNSDGTQSEPTSIGSVLYSIPISTLLSELSSPPSCPTGITTISSLIGSSLLVTCSPSALLAVRLPCAAKPSLAVVSISVDPFATEYTARVGQCPGCDYLVGGVTGVERLWWWNGTRRLSYGTNFGRIWGMYVTGYGNEFSQALYIAVRANSAGQSAVLKFNVTTSRLLQRLGEGVLVAPVAVVIDENDNNTAYVVDSSTALYGGSSSALLAFNSTGHLLRSIPIRLCSIPGQHPELAGIAIDWQSNIYLVDGCSLLILQAATLTLRYNFTDGLTAPVAVAVSQDNGIVVADQVNGLVIMQGLFPIPQAPSYSHSDTGLSVWIVLLIVTSGVASGSFFLLYTFLVLVPAFKVRQQRQQVRRMVADAAARLLEGPLNPEPEGQPFRLA